MKTLTKDNRAQSNRVERSKSVFECFSLFSELFALHE